MTLWHEVQRDFSGGEISQRMFMRDDTEIHGKACLTMENFMPTLQGSAVRTPGTRFLWEIKDKADNIVDKARIIPYITPDGDYALLEIIPKRDALPGEIRIRLSPADALGTLPLAGPPDPEATYSAFQRIVTNDTFNQGEEGWVIDPPFYTNKGKDLGIWFTSGQANIVPRAGKNASEIDTCTLTTTCTIPEDTDQIQIAPNFLYFDNYDDVTEGKFTGTISVGTTPGGTEIWTEDFSDFIVGQVFDRVIPVNTVQTAGTILYLTFTVQALRVDGINSSPQFFLRQFRILSKVTVDIGGGEIAYNNTAVDYTPAEIDDIQYIQSPYDNSAIQDGSFGNELVLVHPNHPPKRVYFSPTGLQYTLQEIPFLYVDEDGNSTGQTPTLWSAGNYPAACTSYLGRLVLAGGNKNPTIGGQAGSTTEKVWMTYVGKWYAFSDPDNTVVTPADSIEFTSTYRSPIQWVHGQTNLLVGSESFEYVSNADGIYSPGDLGIFLQSTHGSEAIQPVPMGQYVLFAAEQGSRVRAMQYVAESEYWIAPDMTINHPELFAVNGRVKRMARMRNPHQICACVMGNGQIALLHQDSYANISGWSRLQLGNTVSDIAVQVQPDGTDIMYMLIKRVIQGVERLYLEGIGDWTYAEENNWGYLRSAVNYIPATAGNVISGLDHLEGKLVQVVSDQDYLGTYRVTSGSVTLLDDTGQPIDVSNAVIGMTHGARIRTMPLITADPGSKKRYADLYVRTRNSSRPLINGTRPADRDAERVLDEAQDLDIVWDNETEDFDWNRTQVIEVKETLPIRTEILGIYGKVKGNSL